MRSTDDGRVHSDDDRVEHALRTFALGRSSWTSCGGERGGQTAAVT